MVVRELLCAAEKTLSDFGIENAAFESSIILRSVLKLDALSLLTDSRREVNGDDENTVLTFAKRRALGEPLEYILGTQEFMSLEFNVNPSVLIPRADTETLVERVIDICRAQGKPLKILDIGAGSGCIGISIAYYAHNTVVTELDISADALAVSEENAKKNGVHKRMRFKRCDILSTVPVLDGGKLDIVVSNPPYIETDVIETLDITVKDFEPRSALDGGADGLMFYKRIVGISDKLLLHGGVLAFEIGYNQGDAVSSLMRDNGFSDVEIIRDLCGNERVVIGKKQNAVIK